MNKPKKLDCANGLLILVAALVLIAGCATRITDPLLGWKRADYLSGPIETVVKDYQDYISKLPPEERKRASPIFYFEDGIGNHAIRITIGLKGTVWQHVLIYDKGNKRIKTIKYRSGSYMS